MQRIEFGWRRLSGEPVSGSIREQVARLLEEARNDNVQLKLCMGTDSCVTGASVELATAIVFVRRGRGGFMLVRREQIQRTMSIRQRMLEEVNRSAAICWLLSDLLEEYEVEFELHADINTRPEFRSHDALKETLGYIQGMGWSFRAKPEAFASSCCADKALPGRSRKMESNEY